MYDLHTRTRNFCKFCTPGFVKVLVRWAKGKRLAGRPTTQSKPHNTLPPWNGPDFAGRRATTRAVVAICEGLINSPLG